MRKLTVACVAAATLTVAPALAADYFPSADYAWRPTVSFRDYYAYYYTDHYAYYYPPVVAPRCALLEPGPSAPLVSVMVQDH